MELSFTEMGKATGATDLGLGTCQEIVFGPIKLEVPVTHPRGDVRHLDIVSRVTKTSPTFIDLEDSTGLGSGTWLRFITEKRYKAQSAKGEDS